MNRRAFDRLLIVVFTVFVTCLLAGGTGKTFSKANDPAACMLTVIGFLVSVSVVWVFISFLYMRSFVIN